MPGRLVFSLLFLFLALVNVAIGSGILAARRPLLGWGVIGLALVECATAMLIRWSGPS